MEVPEKQDAEQDYGWLKPTQFTPGVSGNPGGRPKGRSITAQLRKLIDEGLDGQDIAQALAKTGIKHALKGDFRFWQSLIERTDGKIADKYDDIAKRIADDLRNRSPLAPAPAPGPVPIGDGPAAVQADPGGTADGQDDDEQT